MPVDRAGFAAGGALRAGTVLEWRAGGVSAGAAIERTALLVDVVTSLDVADDGTGAGTAAGELAGTPNVRRERRGGGAVAVDRARAPSSGPPAGRGAGDLTSTGWRDDPIPTYHRSGARLGPGSPAIVRAIGGTRAPALSTAATSPSNQQMRQI
jgi:hypothetical protein